MREPSRAMKPGESRGVSMSFYNMLFGMNPQTDLLLAIIGLKKNDIERFRDVSASEDGATISVYTRTGGGNRSDYPNTAMRKLPTWQRSYDDDFDSTYCTDDFAVPADFINDVKALDDIIGNGIRPEFGRHLVKTLRREPTESDKKQDAHDAESQKLKRTAHFMANGHTFVPRDDSAMKTALEIAEANGGELRSCWGILPIKIKVKINDMPHPNAKSEDDRLFMNRLDVGYDYAWAIDEEYWAHCEKRFAEEFPITMAKIREAVNSRTKKAA